MSKITDEGYILPVVEALSPHESFHTGANKPLLITGVDGNGNKSDYVVKFRGAGRMSADACMRELLAAFLAEQLEMRVVPPVIVIISQNFINLLQGTEAWEYASRSLGFNYGSEYIKHYSTIIPEQSLNGYQLPHAQSIFVFDITIQNPDRTLEKPNMITDGTEIIIYDHELAFSFLLDIFKNPRPWEIRETDLHWIRRLCLLPRIKGERYDFDDFSRRLDNINETFWDTARSLIPNEWMSNQFDLIQQHLSAICSNKEAFITELKKLMA